MFQDANEMAVMKLCSVTLQLLTAGVWAKMVMNYQIRDRKILSNAQVKVIFFFIFLEFSTFKFCFLVALLGFSFDDLHVFLSR